MVQIVQAFYHDKLNNAVMMQSVFDQSGFETPFRSLDKSVWHICSQKLVPDGKEWLRVVELCALELMMNIMVCSIVLEK